MLKVLVSCGNGMGSSLLIKNMVASVFKKQGVEATIDHTSVGEATSIAGSYDVVLCPISFRSQFMENGKTKIVGIQNVLSESEYTEALKNVGVFN